MPRYYVDLDNNRLVTGSQSTQLAPTPKLYQGDKPTLDVELLTRTNGVLGYYTSSASAINVRVGTVGGSAVASALTFSTLTLSATATATAGLVSPVTATGTATLLGSSTASVTAVMNSPATGSLVVTFSQVQMPEIVSIIRGGFLDSLEVPTCGKNFSSAPSALVSYPDIIQSASNQFNLSGNGSTTLYTSNYSGAWPELLKASINMQVISSQGAQTQYYLSSATTFSLLATVNGPSVSTAPSAAQTNITNVNVSFDNTTLIQGNLNLVAYVIVAGDSTTYASGTFVSEKLSITGQAQLSCGLEQNKLQLGVANQGYSYSQSPDVFIVPSSADYDLGSSFIPTSAQVQGRTVVVTASAHGLSAGDYILSENMVVSVTTGGIQAGGFWKVNSATLNNFTFNIDRYACHPTTTVTLNCTKAKVYRVLFRSIATSVSVATSGLGYPKGTDIPFQINPETCAGKSVQGLVRVSNSGILTVASITCAGSGYSSSSTSFPIKVYKSVESITVTCAGAGYWDSENVPDVIVSNSTWDAYAPGATQSTMRAKILGNGQISVSILNSGYGYESAPSVFIGEPNLGNGIQKVSVVTVGTGYSDGTFSCVVATAPSGGTNAQVNFVKNGLAQSFIVVNPGRGYTTVPAVTVAAPDLGGQVSGFTITTSGAGYSDVPSVTLTGGGGSGAAATAILTNGTVTSITLTSQGSGYTSAPAVALAAPPSSVYYSKQIDFSTASVTTFLGGNSSASAYLQLEEKRGSDTTVLAQVPVTIQARVS
jgi:hypothetical protein